MSAENLEFNKEEGKQEYQSVEGVELRKVSEGEDGFEKAIEINGEGKSTEEIEVLVREKLKNQNWWLREYWREKGLPKEQINIEVGDHQIVLYNFGEQLQQRHIDELNAAVADFSKVDGGGPLQRVRYILLDNERDKNPTTGEEKRGDAGTVSGTIILNPRAMSLEDFRREETDKFAGVSDFEACVIHELSHYTPDKFESDWRLKYWKESEKPRQNAGGSISFDEPIEPERCVSEYATTFPPEDICESMIAALRKPEVLDSEKLQVIQSELLKEHESLPVATDRREGAGVELPKIESVNYKLDKAPMRIRGRRSKKEE